MKKIGMLLFFVIAALSVKAQVYVGGEISLWHNDDTHVTSFLLSPEVGYNLNEKWAVGANLTFIHQGGIEFNELSDVDMNGFALAPYARYSYYENKMVRLFIDGGLGFSTYKYDLINAESNNGFEVGFRPGIALKLNKHFSMVAKCGFLGYRDDFMYGENGYGFAFSSEDLALGFHYEF